MTTATVTLEAAPSASPPAAHPRGLLALTLQEAFTAAIRLRMNRQVAPDASAFRLQVKQLLAAADTEARRAGYPAEYVKLAIYAYVAFLDESVLNSAQPMFSAWPRQPLQEEIFGDHMAGETFFSRLQELRARQNSEEMADVLEVYLLCLLLGFRGKYGAGNQAGLATLIAEVQEQIRRTRGGDAPLSPDWAPPDEVLAPSRDRWLPRLAVAAATSAGLALVAYLGYRLSLHGWIGELQSLVASLVR